MALMKTITISVLALCSVSIAQTPVTSIQGPTLGNNTILPQATQTCTSNGDGTCSIDVGSNIEIDFPQDTWLAPFQSSNTFYSEGEDFLFDTPMPSNLTLSLLLVGKQTAWEDIDCGVLASAPGVDGDTLGCIATAVAWITYSMLVSANGTTITTPIRSLPDSDFNFKAHPEWAPTGDCTTLCMQLAGIPQDTWTSVGSGTYNGIHHELHFVHTDNMIGHRVYQGGNQSTLAASQWYYKSNQIGGNGRPIVVDIFTWKANKLYSGDPSTAAFEEAALGVSDWMAQSVEETVANYSGYCFEVSENGQVVSSTLLGISQTSPTWESTFDADRDLTTCKNDESESGATQTGNVLMVCGQNLTWIDPELLDDPDGNTSPNIWARSSKLVKRVGSSQPYTVLNYLDPGGVNLTWESAQYVNGQNGRTLQNSGGDTHVYGLANPGACTDASLRSNAPIDGFGAIQVDAEHILERVTAPYFFEFIQNPVMDLLDGNGPIRAPASLAAIPFNVIRDYMNIPYNEWPGTDQTSTESHFTEFANALGSTTNVGVMTNLQRDLNNVKSRVWDTNVDVTSNKTFDPLAANPTVANTQRALELLRGVS